MASLGPTLRNIVENMVINARTTTTMAIMTIRGSIATPTPSGACQGACLLLRSFAEIPSESRAAAVQRPRGRLHTGGRPRRDGWRQVRGGGDRLNVGHAPLIAGDLHLDALGDARA